MFQIASKIVQFLFGIKITHSCCCCFFYWNILLENFQNEWNFRGSKTIFIMETFPKKNLGASPYYWYSNRVFFPICKNKGNFNRHASQQSSHNERGVPQMFLFRVSVSPIYGFSIQMV